MEIENPIIKIQGLNKTYSKTRALAGIEFSVNKGDIFGILGSNGSGKSTTMKIISGLISFDSGKCFIFNKDIKHNKKLIQQKIGLVTQEYSIYDDLKTWENVEFFGRLYGLRGKNLKENVNNALEVVNLKEYANNYPVTFSGGMKRRLNIACALVHKPELLIMDEPTASLDPISRAYILKSIKDINSTGTTVLYTSHYLDEIEAICNSAIIINKGLIVANGTPEEIKLLLQSKHTINIILEGVQQKFWNEINDLNMRLFIPSSINIILKEYQISHLNKNYHLTINCDNSTKVVSQLIPFLKDRDIYIKNIDIKQNSLEDVFINLLERK